MFLKNSTKSYLQLKHIFNKNENCNFTKKFLQSITFFIPSRHQNIFLAVEQNRLQVFRIIAIYNTLFVPTYYKVDTFLSMLFAHMRFKGPLNKVTCLLR